MKTLRKAIVLHHSVEDIWCALTCPEALAEWLMPNTFTVATAGTKFRFQFDPEPLCASGIVECEILDSNPPHSMIWSWQNGPHKVGGKLPPPMKVEWNLTEVPNGTRLTLIQTGLKGQSWIIPFAMSFGWSAYLKRLLPKVMVNISDGEFTSGAIPMNKRLYKATNLPPEVTR